MIFGDCPDDGGCVIRRDIKWLSYSNCISDEYLLSTIQNGI